MSGFHVWDFLIGFLKNQGPPPPHNQDHIEATTFKAWRFPDSVEYHSTEFLIIFSVRHTLRSLFSLLRPLCWVVSLTKSFWLLLSADSHSVSEAVTVM